MNAWVLVLTPLLLIGAARPVADKWPVPRVQNVFSPNGEYFVRIVPRTTSNQAVASGDPAKPEHARGEFYARARDRSYRLVAGIALQNPVGPTYATVTDSGYLITFDDWFGIGFANVIVFYRPNGELIRRLAIEELYAPDRLQAIPRSVSSRWWRCGVWYTPPGAGGEEAISVHDHFGNVFLLNARTGTFEYRQSTGKCAPGSAMIFS